VPRSPKTSLFGGVLIVPNEKSAISDAGTFLRVSRPIRVDFGDADLV